MIEIKWNRFDNWFVKVTGFLLIVAGFVWSGFAVIYHYQTKATDWEYFPFVAASLMIVFGAALLAKKVAAGATSVLLPILDRIRPGLKPTTSSVLVPPQPAQPAQPAKVITTTVTPVPGTATPQPPEQKG